MKSVIKKTESRRRDENSLKLYHQAFERLSSGEPFKHIKIENPESIFSFVQNRIDEVISRLI